MIVGEDSMRALEIVLPSGGHAFLIHEFILNPS
jgi:hypothetical protein